MINIDTRILEPEFGLNEAELWLLVHLARRLNKDMYCFPSNKTLLEDTGWGMDKLQLIKRSLVTKGLIRIDARFSKKDRQRSNHYKIMTNLVGVYVGIDRLDSIPENPTYPSNATGKSGTGEVPENPVREVLAREEVLTSESKDSLLGTTHSRSTERTSKKAVIGKQKRAAHPAFKLCVEHWLKVVHPGWTFSAVDGKAMNSIIRKIEKRLEKKKHEYSGWVEDEMPEVILNSFKHITKKLPAWYLIQTLPVIDSKFDSIIDQIRNGGEQSNWHSKTSASRVIDTL